jgi:hypothetical protein
MQIFDQAGENHGKRSKNMGKPWENQVLEGFNGIIIGTPWENHRKMEVYRLLNVYITMERSTIFHGTNHYKW